MTTIAAGDRPGTRQRVVDGGDFIAQHVRIRLVEADALLDDGALVPVEWQAAAVIDMGTFYGARLDFENVVAAVAVLVDPFANRIAERGMAQLCRPAAAVGMDSTNLAEPLD